MCAHLHDLCLFIRQVRMLTVIPNSNTSNAASLLWHAYVLDPSRAAAGKKPQLILGPFQGKVACQIIAYGRGVCGVAAATAQTQNVPDVDLFPGHIACDGASKSEIVVPIVVDGKVLTPEIFPLDSQ
jgi:L-methionine (R)-S-oxide reductase